MTMNLNLATIAFVTIFTQLASAGSFELNCSSSAPPVNMRGNLEMRASVKNSTLKFTGEFERTQAVYGDVVELVGAVGKLEIVASGLSDSALVPLAQAQFLHRGCRLTMRGQPSDPIMGELTCLDQTAETSPTNPYIVVTGFPPNTEGVRTYDFGFRTIPGSPLVKFDLLASEATCSIKGDFATK